MSELKPCPICGKELNIHGPEDWAPTFYDPDSGGDPYSADCDCGFTFCNNSYDYMEFLEALNRRAEPANDPLTLDEVAADIMEICVNGGCPPDKDCEAKQDCHKCLKVWLTSRHKPKEQAITSEPVPPAYSHIVQRFNKKE